MMLNICSTRTAVEGPIGLHPRPIGHSTNTERRYSQARHTYRVGRVRTRFTAENVPGTGAGPGPVPVPVPSRDCSRWNREGTRGISAIEQLGLSV